MEWRGSMGTGEGAESEVGGMTLRRASIDRIVVAENTARYGLHNIIECLDFIWTRTMTTDPSPSSAATHICSGPRDVRRLQAGEDFCTGKRAAEWHPSLPEEWLCPWL